jgi:hypothetical protein
MTPYRLYFLVIVVGCFMAMPGVGWGQILPESRTVDWTTAGHDADMPDLLRVENVQVFGAIGDGKSDDRAAVQEVIDRLGGRRGVVYFPAGVYLLQAPLVLPDSVVLRGEGMGVSRLLFDFDGRSGDCISIAGEALQPFTDILAGGSKGALTLTVEDAAGLVPGSYAEIQQENGAWDEQPAPWAANSVGQMVKVVGVSGNRIVLQEALRMELDTALHPAIRPISARHHVGIECLSLERRDRVVGGFGYNISFSYAAECWIRGIESDKSIGSHVFASASTDITISGSYFHDAYEFDGGSTRGYGVTLAHHSGQILVQDNVFQRLRHAMMVKQGANGNVFGYNYSTEVVRTEFPHDLSGDISLHGHYAFANLFEGNVVQNVIIDHYWGPSGPFNTFLRNRAEGYGILLGSLVPNAQLSDSQNFLGNEVTHQLGFSGYFLLTGEDHFSYANRLGDSTVPFAVDAFPDQTYYLHEKPAFFGESVWPPIGIPQPYNWGMVPAQQRFVTGSGLAMCGNEGAATTALPKQETSSWKLRVVYPNPFATTLALEIEAPEAALGRVSIFSLNGEMLWTQTVRMARGLNPFEWQTPAEWPAGVYLIQLKIADQEISVKVQKE